MNKEDMLALIRIRIEELESEYRKYFDTENGPSKSYSGSACLRSRVKKDLGTLKLLEYLILRCDGSVTLNEENEPAFNRLVEPRRLK